MQLRNAKEDFLRLCAASDVTVGITHGAWYTSWLRTVSAASGEEAACFFFVLPHRCAASSCVCVFFCFFLPIFLSGVCSVWYCRRFVWCPCSEGRGILSGAASELMRRFVWRLVFYSPRVSFSGVFIFCYLQRRGRAWSCW